MFKSLCATLASLATLSLAAPASAGIVYSQPGTQACSPSCWTSSIDAGFAGFAASDNFTLTASALVTGVTWQGIYIDGSAVVAPTPSTATWYIGLIADTGGMPGTPVQLDTASAAAVTTTLIGTGSFGSSPVNLYSFSYDFNVPVVLAAGDYWFTPLSQSGGAFSPFFSWSPATVDVDGATYQIDSNGNQYSRPNDRAFSIVAADPVPEPASWAMMIGGFALIGGAMRRRAMAPVAV